MGNPHFGFDHYILSIFVAFSEYMNFKRPYVLRLCKGLVFFMFEFILFILLKLDQESPL